MPKSTQQVHHDTIHYIPRHHRKEGLSYKDQKIFKILQKRLFYEGRVVHQSFLDNTDIPEVFSAINFDCLLPIDEQICPVFVLEFYKSVRIIRNNDRTISIAFVIKEQSIVLPLNVFAEILRAPCRGVCMHSSDWSLANLHNVADSNPIYHTPLDNPVTVRNTVFIERTEPTRYTRNKELINRDPFQMELFEMFPDEVLWKQNTETSMILAYLDNKTKKTTKSRKCQEKEA